jgi:GST-like protein
MGVAHHAGSGSGSIVNLSSAVDKKGAAGAAVYSASDVGPFSGQAVHFQSTAPEGVEYAVSRHRREAERHCQVLNDHLEGRTYILGDTYAIADMSAWGWLDRASRVRKGADDPLASFASLKRVFQTVDARPAAARARELGKGHPLQAGQ